MEPCQARSRLSGGGEFLSGGSILADCTLSMCVYMSLCMCDSMATSLRFWALCLYLPLTVSLFSPFKSLLLSLLIHLSITSQRTLLLYFTESLLFLTCTPYPRMKLWKLKCLTLLKVSGSINPCWKTCLIYLVTPWDKIKESTAVIFSC